MIKRKKVLRWLKRAVLLLILIVFVYLFAWPIFIQYDPLHLRPELTRKLSGNFHEGNVEFKQRINNRYPEGSNESSVVKELSEQGFTVSAYMENGKLMHRAEYSVSSFPCLLRWFITWQTQNDMMHAIIASQGGQCL